MDSKTTKPPAKCSAVTKRNSDLSQASSTNDGASNCDNKQATKKLPPIKAPVGLAKSPDLKNCKSKIGSLNNIKHKPAGGSVTIQSQKLNWDAKSKVGSLENKEHKPSGGKLKVESRKLEWKATSKVQSLQNVNHKPGGGNVKIFNDTYREKKFIEPNHSDHSAQSNPTKTNQEQANNAKPTNKLTKDLKNMSLT